MIRLDRSIILLLIALGPQLVSANDAYSIALGGLSTTFARGAESVKHNPATLMLFDAKNHSRFFQIGLSAEVRDSGDFVEVARDNADLPTELENQINQLSDQTLLCDPETAVRDSVCLINTERLGANASQLIQILDTLDQETVETKVVGGFGFASIGGKRRYSIHYDARVTVAGPPIVNDQDRSYINQFAIALEDGDLTWGEALDAAGLSIDPIDGVVIDQPDSLLSSELNGSVIYRQQISYSQAKMISIANHSVSIGITPKLSYLQASSLDTEIGDIFDTQALPLIDEFNSSGDETYSFTFDVGTAFKLKNHPVTLAVVGKNLLPESIETRAGVKLNTTPQLLFGAAYKVSWFKINADAAVNAASVDGFKTQRIALGVQLGKPRYALLFGVSSDLKRTNDATAASAGFVIGPLEFGARISGFDAIRVGLQLSFAF